MKHYNYQLKLTSYLLISAFLLLALNTMAETRIEWPEEYGYPDVVDWNEAHLDLFTGYPYRIVIEVINDDDAELEIERIFSEHDYFTADPEELSLEPHSDAEVTLIFETEADDPGEYEATMVFISNDPDNEEYEINLHAEASRPPEFPLDADPIEENLFTGQIAENELIFENTGGSPLRFVIEHGIIDEPERDENGRTLRTTVRSCTPSRDWDEIFRLNAPVNTYKSGIAYDYENEIMYLANCNADQISGISFDRDFENFNEEIRMGAENPMGMAWMDGVLYYISWPTDRLLRLDSDGQMIGSIELPQRPTALTCSQDEERLITISDRNWQMNVYELNGNQVEETARINWRQDALQGQESRSICWVDEHPDGQLWINIPNYIVEVMIDTDEWEFCEIVNDYEWDNGEDEWAGIGHDGRNLWLGAYCNPYYLIMDDGINERGWLYYQPSEGVIEPDEEEVITITLDATYLIGGDYEADLIILTNVPEDPEVIVNILMHVEGAPDIDVTWPEELGYPDVLDLNMNEPYHDPFTGGPYEFILMVSNLGTEDLEIEDIHCDHEYFYVSPEDMLLEPREEAVITLTFEAPEDDPGEYEAVLVFVSNDPDEAEYEILVRAEVSLPPRFGVDPATINAELHTGDIEEFGLEIYNHGDGLLRYSVEVELMDEYEDLFNGEYIEYHWERAGVNHYKHAHYDHDNEWMVLSGYNPSWIAAIRYDYYYRDFDEVWVIQLNNPEISPMEFFVRNGVIYCPSYNSATCYRFDSEGNLIDGTLEISLRPDAMSYSPELELLFCYSELAGDEAEAASIHVYEFVNDTEIERVGNFPLRGQHSIPFDFNTRSISWVDEHHDGQLWIHIDSRVWQIHVDTEEWSIIEAINQFRFPGNQIWDGIAHDGHNFWLCAYSQRNIFIVNDRISELNWLGIEPFEGEIEPDEEEPDIDVTINATGLRGGRYEGHLIFHTNDPENREVVVDVNLTVLGAHDIDDSSAEDAVPHDFYLSQPHPNPFNAVTSLSYNVLQSTQVTITVYDLTGRRLTTLVNGEHLAGKYTAVWNAHNVSSGVYIVRMEADGFRAVRKVLLVR
ncbi:MAG: T9SS type A sorting domain-containing protein [Candidatus Hatepunaea meridiana]|nr:T9SS type A sorting domain-containing protein [Candidatus Hatepunaea meridiana]